MDTVLNPKEDVKAKSKKEEAKKEADGRPDRVERLLDEEALFTQVIKKPWFDSEESAPECFQVSHDHFSKHLSTELQPGESMAVWVQPPGKKETEGARDEKPLACKYELLEGAVGRLDLAGLRNFMVKDKKYKAEVLENDEVQVFASATPDTFVMGLTKEKCPVCGEETGYEDNGPSYICEQCDVSTHVACSGLKKALKDDEDFVCRKCKPPTAEELAEEQREKEEAEAKAKEKAEKAKARAEKAKATKEKAKAAAAAAEKDDEDEEVDEEEEEEEQEEEDDEDEEEAKERAKREKKAKKEKAREKKAKEKKEGKAKKEGKDKKGKKEKKEKKGKKEEAEEEEEEEGDAQVEGEPAAAGGGAKRKAEAQAEAEAEAKRQKEEEGSEDDEGEEEEEGEGQDDA